MKRIDAEVVYTNNLPSGAFRGYGLGQVILGIESAMDMLAERLGIDPFDLRRLNAVQEGDPLHETEDEYEEDLVWGSYGLDQCLDLAEAALRRGNGVDGARRLARRRGHGARDAVDHGARRPHLAHHGDPPPRRHVPARGRHGRVRQRHHDRAPADRGDGAAASFDRLELRHADTDAVRHDTGAFASAGITVAGKALHAACVALRSRMVAIAAGIAGAPLDECGLAGGRRAHAARAS